MGRKRGCWVDLGGQVDPGEEWEEGAAREFGEEGGDMVVSREHMLELLRDPAATTVLHRKQKKNKGNKQKKEEEQKQRGGEWRLFVVVLPSSSSSCLPSLPSSPFLRGHKLRRLVWLPLEEFVGCVARARKEGIPPAELRSLHAPLHVWRRLAQTRRLRPTLRRLL